MKPPSLKVLLTRLEEDAFRKKGIGKFSSDLVKVQKLLFHPFASATDKKSALSAWLQRNQPCIFGRLAAATDRMHYCILTDADLQSDEIVKNKIHEELLAWKRRSLRPVTDVTNPAHGFFLVVASEKVALARPDQNLRAFAERIREIWGCKQTTENQGLVHWEELFLEHPKNGKLVKFTFGVDFFAAQGDRRWWHDHRIPGGIAFTANSVGHMRRYREWYQNMKGQKEWVLKTAMETIDAAQPTSDGKATWLKELANGKPQVVRLKCPFSAPDKLKENLKEKDWTRYGGYLHTDHSIRSEFFFEDRDKRPDLKEQQYLQDFTYLFDPKQRDHTLFIAGEDIDRKTLDAKIGEEESWTAIAAPMNMKKPSVKLKKPALKKPAAKRTFGAPVVSHEVVKGREQVTKLLRGCNKWKLTDDELREMNSAF